MLIWIHFLIVILSLSAYITRFTTPSAATTKNIHQLPLVDRPLRSVMHYRQILYILVTISATYAEDAPVIRISTGLLQGTLDTSYNGRIFSSFKGVPYAKPPVGKLRFQEPRAPYNWTGTWIANSTFTCISSFNDEGKLGITGAEDCLYLNVYVPRAEPSGSDNLDVLVHIHGGAFMLGNGHFYAGPKYLMDEEIIFVTINYRVGPFGFLSTEDRVVPGNNGLKDQVQALKWIQNNIEFFGGNPNSVTLTGMSAGGASVQYHYLSPLSKGLFHRGISESGTVLDPWTLQEAGLEKAKHLGALLGCPTATSRELIRCLQWRPAQKIEEAVKTFLVYGTVPFSPFAPVVEVAHPDAFLQDHPYSLLTNKQVADLPWITSITENEGIYPAAFFNKQLTQLNQDIDEILPHILDYNYTVRDSERKLVTKDILGHYFKESVNLDGLIRVCGDRHFKVGCDAAARLQAQANNKSSVYIYIMRYRGGHSFSEIFLNADDNIGVSHGDDVQYYLSTPFQRGRLSEADEKMKSVFMQWILSFIRTNQPKISGVLWEPVTGNENLNVLNIISPYEISMETEEDLGSRKFWSKIPLVENENA